jgi:hypothetical protein
MKVSVKSASSSAIPVRIEEKLYESIKAYSDLTGVPVVRVVHEAVEDFVATTLHARLEALQTKQPSNVVLITDAPRAFAAAQGQA